MSKCIILACITCMVICLVAICGHADDPIWYDSEDNINDN